MKHQTRVVDKNCHGRGVPQGKGSRLIIVDAGTRHGFLPDAPLQALYVNSSI